jgi:ketosteroid isomerase-like protein
MTTIEDLVAESEIRAVLARYCRGVDRGDRDLILSVYHDDAHDDHGNYNGDAIGFAEQIITKFDAAPEIGQHHVTNILIDLDGDIARVESYFLAINPGMPETGYGHDLVAGRYLDTFTRKNGEWRIQHRRVVMDVTRDAFAGEPWPADKLAVFPTGGRRENDPSSGFFNP